MMHGSRPVSEEMGMLLCRHKPGKEPLETQVKTLNGKGDAFAQKAHSGKERGTAQPPKTSVLNDLRLPVGNAFCFIAF